MGCFTSFPEYIEHTWYPLAQKRAEKGFLACTIKRPGFCQGSEFDLMREFGKKGLTKCYGESDGVASVSWDGAVFGMGGRLYNLAMRVRGPLRAEVKKKSDAADNGSTTSFCVELSRAYSTDLLEDVVREIYPSAYVKKIGRDSSSSANHCYAVFVPE